MTSLDLLIVVFMVMTGVSVFGLLLMYLVKNETVGKLIFYGLAVFGMIIAVFNALSTPDTYLIEAIIGWGIGAVSAVALLIQIIRKNERSFLIARILVTFSVVAGMANLFLI